MPVVQVLESPVVASPVGVVAHVHLSGISPALVGVVVALHRVVAGELGSVDTVVGVCQHDEVGAVANWLEAPLVTAVVAVVVFSAVHLGGVVATPVRLVLVEAGEDGADRTLARVS